MRTKSVRWVRVSRKGQRHGVVTSLDTAAAHSDYLFNINDYILVAAKEDRRTNCAAS